MTSRIQNKTKKKFKLLFFSTLSHKLAQQNKNRLKELPEAVWLFFEELEDLELETFLSFLECLLEAKEESKKRLDLEDSQLWIKPKD